MEKSILGKCHSKLWFVFLFSFPICLVLLSYDNASLILLDFANAIGIRNFKPFQITRSSNTSKLATEVTGKSPQKEPVYVPPSPENYVEINKTRENVNLKADLDSCLGQYIYVHNLPGQFNDELLKNCRSLIKWMDMCPSVLNMGLGPQVENSGNILLKNSWFSTNQFTLGVIFHNRMKQYKCLTNDSSLASAIFVPYYAGLDVGRYLWGVNTSVRDSSPSDMVRWLAGRSEWKRMSGRDHFLVAGRIGWDFRRQSDNDSDWGNNLMFLPESKNMTMLSIESTSWKNDFAIPYPTYFHPSRKSEVYQWQNRMRKRKRHYLFSFAGAPRPGQQDSIRGEIIRQCQASGRLCKLLDCSPSKSNCDNPVNVIRTFQNSIFCLQPQGDSYTRRSSFDSILAGCIPVFFHSGSAYDQYLWHLPKNYSKYSVFIPMKEVKDGKVRIDKTLLRVSKDEISSMRKEAISLIPKVVYADPRFRLSDFEDAFDIAVRGVLERVETVRREIKEGKDPSVWFS